MLPYSSQPPILLSSQPPILWTNQPTSQQNNQPTNYPIKQPTNQPINFVLKVGSDRETLGPPPQTMQKYDFLTTPPPLKKYQTTLSSQNTQTTHTARSAFHQFSLFWGGGGRDKILQLNRLHCILKYFHWMYISFVHNSMIYMFKLNIYIILRALQWYICLI